MAYGTRRSARRIVTVTSALPAPGIKSKSQRGDIGASWWSQRFVALLEKFGMGDRLRRGRDYARRGQVLSLDVGPGQVKALVQGSRRTPYEVKLGLAPLDDAAWEAVQQQLASQAVFLAALLSGEMPQDIESVFQAAGSPLFPSKVAELHMNCSCPDWAVPCKHLAAALYLLAERFDEDPFQIFAWRGRTQEQLMAALRGSRQEVEEEAPAVSTLGATLEGFWVSARPVSLVNRAPEPAVIPDLSLRSLGALGMMVGGRDVTEHLALAYPALAKVADR